MTDNERRYTGTEAATLIGCAPDTVRTHARRLFGRRGRPGTYLRLTATQLEQLRQLIAGRRRDGSEPGHPDASPDG